MHLLHLESEIFVIPSQRENISAQVDMFCRQEWPYKIIDDGIILGRMQISR